MSGSMKWTTDKPTEPGWYWYRDIRNHKELYRPLYYAQDDIDDLHKWGSEYGEWSGPLELPKE